MSNYVTALKNVGKQDIGIAGGKGANLGELLQSGIRVPDGFVVTADAYRIFIQQNSINCEQESEKIQEQIRAGKFSKEIQSEIFARYDSMGSNIRVAVRSSATAEDLPEASFAGQQETYLNVMGAEELLTKIKACYASLFGQRAVVYRRNHGFDHADIALAVVVQEMVECECAGVLFTANPTTANKDEILVNASFGLGESVVSGAVTPDSFLLDSNGKIKKKVLGSKETQIIYCEMGTKTISTMKKQKESFSLTKNQLQKLAEQGKRIEKHYKMPMDIEWGICGENVYILQARAITTLKNQLDPVEISSATRPLNRMQKNIVNNVIEHFPRAVYPLDYEVGMILQDIKESLIQEMGITMGTTISIDQNGYSYIPKLHSKLNSNLFHIKRTIKEYQNKEQNLAKGQSAIRKIRNTLDKLSLAAEKIEAEMSAAETMGFMKQLIEVHRQISYTRFRYYIFPGVLFGRKLQKYLKKAGNISEYDLLSGLDYKTLTINQQLQKMAEKIIKEKALCQALQDGREYAWLQENFARQWKMVDEFLGENGWKSDLCCYPYSSVTWNENKEHFLVILNSVMKSVIRNEKKSQTIRKGKYEQIKQGLMEQVPKRKKQKIEEDIAFYRACMVGREETQYLWETGFALLRKWLAHLELLWTNGIRETGDLKFLFQNELWEACKRGYLNKADQQKLQDRKTVRIKVEEAWNKIGLEALKTTGDDLFGESGSAGSVTGTVCIVKDSQDFHKLEKGDILVCHFTDPEWTPLFALASGVVADTGGALSHAAIVAREYKIPAVLGVGTATIDLRDGDIVFVNGDKGVVKKITQPGKVWSYEQ